VREALFSMLAADGLFSPERPAPRVLDLYAGSGALGLEALSRGAGSLVLVESDKHAVVAIRENVRSLGVGDQVIVMTMRVSQALEGRVGGPFDLILVDPPYAEVRSPLFATVLVQAARLLTAPGILVLEHASSDEPAPPSGLHLDRRRRHGDTSLSLFIRADATEEPPR
jgi:16S rRNA (guanine(966)-N(2))-methyltransferase RsmD